MTSWLHQLHLLKPPLDSSLLVSVRDLSPERKRGKEIQLIPLSAAGEAWCSKTGCLAPTKRNPRIVDIDHKGPERSCTATSLNGGDKKDLRRTGPPSSHKSIKDYELSRLRRGLQDETRGSRMGSATEQLCDLWEGTQPL